jgi:hypothetical protein
VLTYIALIAVAIALLLVGLSISTRLTYRTVAPQLVPTIRKMRKLAGETITYRPMQTGESIPASTVALFDAAQREVTSAGFTVLGDLMEVDPDGQPKPTRWFVDRSGTICGWFGAIGNKPVMMLFSEAERDTYFITGRGATSTATAQPPTNHREFLGWDVGFVDVVARHKAQIAQSGTSAIVQPATLEAAPAVVSRLREATARWRRAQPPNALLEQDVRALVGKKWKYVGPTLVRLLRSA